MDQCIYDFMANGDLELAESLTPWELPVCIKCIAARVIKNHFSGASASILSTSRYMLLYYLLASLFGGSLGKDSLNSVESLPPSLHDENHSID